MRCTSCGLPLSPQRTHCPRCGKAAGESGKQEQQVNKQVGTPQFALSASQENSALAANAETIQGFPTSIAQQQAGNQMPEPIFYAPGAEQFPNQINQLSPNQDQTLLSHPDQSSNRLSSPSSDQKNIPPRSMRPGEFQPLPSNPQRPGQTRKVKLQSGFTVAGLCVLSGALILMLVFIISLNLGPLATSNQAPSTVINTPAAQNGAPGTQGGLPTNSTPTSSLPTPSPTADLPGKAYIDNAQMSSAIDLITALPSQTTTTFAVSQKIFVTFTLHPTKSGAVCLIWSINQKQFSHFEFLVSASTLPQHSYSYAVTDSPGQGSVNIYWASSTACTDELLAQTISFTVTP